MKRMNWVRTAVFVAVLGILGIGFYNLQKENQGLRASIQDMTATLANVEAENGTLQSRIDYFRVPDNLLKELKSQFNYKQEGEQMIIIVPKSSSTPPTTF